MAAARSNLTLLPIKPGSGSGKPSFTLEVASLIEAMVEDLSMGLSVPDIARRFHTTVSKMLAAACLKVRRDTGLTTVALSGGVFQNRLLTEQLVEQLKDCGFEV